MYMSIRPRAMIRYPAFEPMLAAGTSTGDLRCDYGPVSVPFGGVEVPTGRTKVGSLIGDHAKTGLSVILNCGTALGAFALTHPNIL